MAAEKRSANAQNELTGTGEFRIPLTLVDSLRITLSILYGYERLAPEAASRVNEMPGNPQARIANPGEAERPESSALVRPLGKDIFWGRAFVHNAEDPNVLYKLVRRKERAQFLLRAPPSLRKPHATPPQPLRIRHQIQAVPPRKRTRSTQCSVCLP